MGEEEIKKSGHHPADTNGDGKVSRKEQDMYLEFKRKELEDADAMRDAQRKMAWFALGGMLLYPFAVVIAVLAGLDQASKILGDMAATYFVAVAGIVAAFFGSQAFSSKK
mgnify:FL=1|tara:strand:+ start:476 stop:805 length:330 start_codon:yes stop_codon:yes gene_type:complete